MKAEEGSLTADSVVFNWKLKSVTGITGDDLYTHSAKDELQIAKDGTFLFSVVKDSVKEKGTWKLRNDSLIFSYELIPISGPVDSIVYMAKDNTPSLLMYSGGNQIAKQSIDGLESKRRTKAYKVNIDKRGNVVLKGLEDTMYLSGRARYNRPAFSIIDVLRGLFGVFVLLFVAYLCSANRKAIDWKLVGTGISLQLVFAILVLKVGFIRSIFAYISDFFVEILAFTREGSTFLFGNIITDVDSFGFIFAFQILPTIVFFSALTSLLYYLGILQKVVYGFAWVMSKTMRLSGAESLAAAGNIFLGQTESPLLVKPYLDKMTKSEIMCLMTGGMATIAGGVFAAYIGYLGGTDPEQTRLFATHLLTASIMSAPAAIVAAKILFPETEEVSQDLSIPKDRIGSNVLDAISNGTGEGLKLAVNVGIMLLTFIAFIAMVNFFFLNVIGEIGGLNEWVASSTEGRFAGFNLQYIFGVLFSPFAWALGVPSDDIMIVGQLLGEKTIINEFVAYGSLGQLKGEGLILNYKSVIIATYALCGFSNFASIGIQIGGIGALAPNQRTTLSALGVRALIGSTIACFLTASIAGMLANW